LSKRDCVKFGYAIGNSPSQASLYEVFKQIKHQSDLITEECQELSDAVVVDDMIEILDGCMDIKFLNTYLEHLLEAYGCNVKGAWDAVCSNNLGKTTNSITYAQLSKEAQEENGTPCYVDSIVFEGETVYTVKRQSDSKVMKLLNHVRPDLEQFVGKEFR
jgi:hypothetical protein